MFYISFGIPVVLASKKSTTILENNLYAVIIEKKIISHTYTRNKYIILLQYLHDNRNFEYKRI